MTTQYTSILKLALPVQGELSGTWGDVVNDNITSMVEQAIAGRAVINSWSSNSHTLTTANGTTSESRCAMLEFTDTGTQLSGAGTVVCPALSKIYIAKNAAGQNVTLKTASGTGILVPNGRTMFLFCDGTNVVEAVTSTTSLQLGTSTTVTAVLDEDNMASNSATSLATQQSIKAYVDAQVGSFDTLAEVLAQGNTTGSTNIEVTSAQKVQFRDSAIYINSSADGQLDLVADTEIQIAATTIDINGAINASGEIIAASLDISGDVDVDGTLETDALSINGTTVTSTAAELNILDGVTATTAELNILDGVTATTAELNILDGVTATTAELNYVDGVTSNVQTQLNAKSPIASPTFTGTVTIPTADINAGSIDGTAIGASSASTGAFTTLTASGLTVDTNTLYVDSTNNRVGVGTTSPASTFEIAKNDQTNGATLSITNSFNSSGWDAGDIIGSIDFRTDDTSTTQPIRGQIKLFEDSASGTTYANSNAMSFSTGRNDTLNERMIIDSSGNVGIGTSAIMEDFGGGRTTLALKGTGTADYSTLQLGNYGTSSNGQIHGLINFYDGTTSVSRIQSVRASNTSDANLAFYTAPSSGGITERMRIDSSGAVGIGTSSPATGYRLDISGSSGYDDVMRIVGVGTNIGPRINLTPTGTGNSRINATANSLLLQTGGTERMRIDSTRVTVGNGSGSQEIKVDAGAGWADLKLHSDATNGGSIYFNDGADAGQIFYYHPENSMRFHTNASERMRIDSSGNVLVGKTTLDGTGSRGLELRADGLILASKAGQPMSLDRTGSDGVVCGLYKDGAIVGSVGVGSTRLTIGSNGASGLRFDGANVMPMSSGSLSDGAVDIGYSANRFKDIHFAGRMYGNFLRAGESLPSSTDFNDLKTSGFYRVDNNATNAPNTAYHALVIYGNSSNVVTQIATSLSATTTYVRSFNTAWTSWARLDT